MFWNPSQCNHKITLKNFKKGNYYQETKVLLFIGKTVSLDKNKNTKEGQLKNQSFNNFAGPKNKYEIAKSLSILYIIYREIIYI